MAIRKILNKREDALHKNCRPVEKFDDRLAALLDDMAETMVDANGVGLAAPQVGILRRVAVIDVGDGVIEFINPVIISSEGEQEEMEGCLSVPNEWGLVKRPAKVVVQAQDRNGNPFEITGEGLLAIACCHEFDHLDGHIFTEKATHMFTPQEMEEYLDRRDRKSKK